MKDSWSSGDPYELFMGRWSSLMASEFLDFLSLPPNKDILDIGCGTGALSEKIINKVNPSSLTCIEPSSVFLEMVRSRVGDKASYILGDASFLDLRDDSIDIVLSGLAFNFFPDYNRALAEMKRVTRKGGIIAFYIWDYAGKMEFLRYFWDAAIKVDPRAKNMDEGLRFPICNKKALIKLFTENALSSIVIEEIDILTHFRDFDDYWKPFLGGQGPAPGFYNSLNDQQQIELVEELKLSLPFSEDGTCKLIARSFAVSAKV